ncbi:SMC family ATPase [Streptomyces sp. NPDC050617]|uniref:SMC family ATPase n=1 Tax=Streptomyces sp. NPDC050617 TaxID=3154628 RepID=UPI00343C0D1F
MRLHRLTLTAFGPFGAAQHIDFDELSAAGLFLLHGPTGAGKTSVLDAVCYALYGGVPGARQGPGLTLRSDHAQPLTPTEVVLELTAGGRRLELTRRPEQLRPKKRGSGYTKEKAYCALREQDAGSGEWKALSRSNQEIGEEITQLLGMSREQFCQVVLLPQGDFARFLHAEDTARGKLLGRLFDTGRFAAVEDKLAELRRAAEERVRGGDERLLAAAHRMAQAAGDSTELRENPLPELAPGEPGLAAAVLAWAAQARTSAREREAVVAAAVLAAEDAHRTAREHADAARELARLQERHARARDRAAQLEDRREEHEQMRRRLETARAAESVAPALALRDDAERAWRAAGDAERRARAGLDPDHADAGADRLAALERRFREDLGSLTAARRAEQRAAEVAAERAALDREARADEDTAAEAAEWIAGWETARHGCQRRIDAAQEAAARAEQLGARIDPTREQLAAAQRRDGLAAQADAAADRLRQAREAASAARENWLDLKERRLHGIAAELAAELTPGEPCKVCGANEHPAPARAAAGQVDRAAEDAALAASQRADAARDTADRQAQELREALAGAAAAAGGATVAELTETLADLRRAYEEARGAGADVHAAREALDRAEREYERRRAEQQEAERRTAARTSRREALDRRHAELAEEVERARGGAATVARRAELLERRLTALAAAAEAVRAAQDAADRLKEADARLADAAYRAGFDTPQHAARARLADDEHRRLRHRLDQWQTEESAVAAELADEQTAAAARRPAADVDGAQAAAEAATRRLRETSAEDAAARARCGQLDELSERAVADARALAPLREDHARLARLAALAAGTAADNERKMRLESYVLAARLEQVAAAATARLSRMSSGRYTLVHSDARTGGRGRSGLGLHVIDAWTGRERDTATLSGGETFFASLALALGLADVVTDEAGGTRLDTLFIDEGFGSLDEQTLDEVLDVLDSLRERDRAVGIVSHVADLRQRIPAQLRVVKDRAGSAVRHQVAGATA